MRGLLVRSEADIPQFRGIRLRFAEDRHRGIRVQSSFRYLDQPAFGSSCTALSCTSCAAYRPGETPKLVLNMYTNALALA